MDILLLPFKILFSADIVYEERFDSYYELVIHRSKLFIFSDIVNMVEEFWSSKIFREHSKIEKLRKFQVFLAIFLLVETVLSYR